MGSKSYFFKESPIHVGSAEIKAWTDDYSIHREISRGKLEILYKGIDDGKHTAVKVPLALGRTNADREAGFEREFDISRQFRHRHILPLVYYCRETTKEYNSSTYDFEDRLHLAFCYEYAPNGSLRKYMAGEEGGGLDWHARYRIIRGICEGLNYLHHHPSGPFYHLDLKPETVLLCGNMVPKLSGFGSLDSGLNRSTGETTSEVLRYAPPEYLRTCEISEEFNIYSLGVIIMEIVAGPDIYDEISAMSQQEVIDLVCKKWKGVGDYCRAINTCIEIAFKCVNSDEYERPKISEIICELNNVETIEEGCADDGSGEDVNNDVESPEQGCIDDTDEDVSEDAKTSKHFIIFENGGKYSDTMFVGVHPTKQRFITCHRAGEAFMWDYSQEVRTAMDDISDKQVCTGQLIGEEMYAAGDTGGRIHMRNFITDMELSPDLDFQAHRGRIDCLAIHPSKGHVLSVCNDDSQRIKIWSKHKNWRCSRFWLGRRYDERVKHIVFNPWDPDVFAAACTDGCIEFHHISSVSDSDSETLQACKDSDGLFFVDYFTLNGRKLLITACEDGSAKIWKRHRKRHVYECVDEKKTRDGFLSACCHPDLPLLVTGTKDGLVHLLGFSTGKFVSIYGYQKVGTQPVHAIACMNSVWKDCYRFVAGVGERVLLIEARFVREEGGRKLISGGGGLYDKEIVNKIRRRPKQN